MSLRVLTLSIVLAASPLAAVTAPAVALAASQSGPVLTVDAFHAAMLYLGHQNALQDALTVQENLAFYAALAGDSGQALRTVPALTRMGVRTCQHKLVRHLSQGQKRRAALSRLLLTQAPLWILDEPFVALDHAAILTLAEVVSEHLQQGGMVIMTSHQDVAIAARQEQSLELGA